jgi:hypothetical protein
MKRCFYFWLCTALATLAAQDAIAQTTLHVSQASPNPTPPYATWDSAARTIQEAVDAASDGDTVLVAAGEYALTNQVTVTKEILLRSGGGASQTILNGQTSVRCLWVSNSVAVVDGFTITQGSSDERGGGGVYLVGGTVQNCIVDSCHSFRSDVAGGAVVIGGTLSNSVVTGVGRGLQARSAVDCSGGGLITDCQIIGNGGPNGDIYTGAVYLTDSELRDSVITNNYASTGGGVYALSSTIVGCDIRSNWTIGGQGGGAYLDRCVVDRCIVANNRNNGGGYPGGRGGGIFATDSVIRDSLIAGNRAASGDWGDSPGVGGGVYLRGGRLLNCTLTGNQAADSGGIYVESGNIRNSIVYFNSASTNANWYNVGGTFDHSCTTPDPGGVGNRVADPQFVDPPNGNYRLGPTSPCIDAGLNEVWMSSAHDLDGNPRIHNGTVDMGAWESTYASPIIGSQPLVKFTPPRANNGFIRSLVEGLPGQGTIIVERSTDLIEWHPIRTNSVTGETFELVEPIRLDSPQQFFRALIRY